MEAAREQLGHSNNTGRRPRVFFSVAEPSADLHGAALIRALNASGWDLDLVGLAGPRLQAAGCTAVDDMTAHAAMVAGAIRQVPRAWSVLQRCRRYLDSEPVDLAVMIDSPALNLPMAKYARRAGIPVLYYIAPQVWAWARWRVHRVRRRVTRLACLLPFEESYFRERGLDAEFVGHPLFDTLARLPIDQDRVATLRGLGAPLITIMPGSRRHVVAEVLPGQIAVARAIAAEHPNVHFCVSVASELVKPLVEEILADCGLAYSLHQDENGMLLKASTLALVASGTATLEVGFFRTPMVVMYNGSRLGWHLVGRWLMKLKQMSLVNILAGRELVPEFMPFYRSTEPIAAVALELLRDADRRQRLLDEMEDVLKPLRKPGAHERTAGIIGEMLTALGFAPGRALDKADGARTAPTHHEKDVAVPEGTATSFDD